MNFQFTPTPQIVFGQGAFNNLPTLIAGFGKKVLLVVGRSSFLKSKASNLLFNGLNANDISYRLFQVEGEPSPEHVDNAVTLYRKWMPSVVVAIGGGSAIDAGKAISAMLMHPLPITHYLEGVGDTVPNGDKVPFIAVPTTSGTGSEATKNAVITQPGADGFKKSLRHDRFVPDIALIDPLLTLDCPAHVTAASGMDAFTQLLESYLSTQSTPMTDALALDGMEKLMGSIEKAVFNGSDVEARTNMSYAALVSGVTIANAGLGLVHGFAQPLGSLFPVPHGVVCGTLMGAVNRVTVKRLRENDDHRTLGKYHKVALLLGSNGNQEECTDRLIDYLDELTVKFQLPKLSDFGIKGNDFPLIIQHTGMKFHPVQLSNDDLMMVLRTRC